MALLRFFSTDVRRGWVLCNIVFAALPVAVVLLSGGADIYASVLSYCYAFLVVGTYLYYRYIKAHDSSEKSDTIFWSSVVVIVLVLLLLQGYNSNPLVVKIVNYHISTTIFISLATIVVVFYLAFKLNLPMITIEEAKDEKARIREERRREKAQSAKQDAQKGRAALEASGQEGNNEVI